MKRKQVLLVAIMMCASTWSVLSACSQEPAAKPPASPAPATVPPQAAPDPTVPPVVAGAQAAAGVQPAVAATDSTRYILSPDDTLQITVWKEPGFSGNVPIRPDGMISLSLVGDLPAAGFTPMQLGMDIAARLKKYIQDPSVTVTVLSVRPKQVFLLGEVAHVGPLTITPEMTPLQAIAAAGGLTPFAKAKNIYILRGAAGHQTKVPYNYKKALKDGDEQGVSLVPGDTIVVP